MDPKLSASVERLVTVAVAYLLARQSANIQGLGPDVAAVVLAGGSAAWGWWTNRKAAILTTAAGIPEVAKIELKSNGPDSAALAKATPDNVILK